MDEVEKTEESVPKPFLHGRQPCRFFSQGKRCHFGEKCKFLHVRNNGRDHEKKPNLSEANTSQTPTLPSLRPCRYFLSGHCTMEDRCRFWHPPQHAPMDEQPVPAAQTKVTQNLRVSRPGVCQDVKLSDMTDEVTKQLCDTEITQLKKRFPKDQLIIQERSDGKVTYYRATVEATDPDWPFDLKEVDIMVSFPDNYPQEIFTLEIPLDQDLPSVMARHVQQASVDWLQAKHATNQLMGKVELLFRPYLRWLDRSLERLFTEGARQLKKDVDLERAGLQFISYEELQATAGQNADCGGETAVAEDDGDEGERPVEEEPVQGEPAGCDEEEQQEKEASSLVENVRIRDPRRGTEVKLLGLRLGENTATVAAQNITVCLQCNRCKVTADLTLNGRTPCTAQCEKCNASINAAFRPCMLHHYCDILGYLDLHNATPADLVLQECELIVGCLSCSQDGPLQSIIYGQTKEVNCEHCHSKLSILAESARFQFIRPQTSSTGSGGMNYKTIRDPAVQKGKPLPEKGTCKHYKQSQRWLRFPCCGRAYPCDVCHDENQDHPMELATRMICGFCAKEQFDDLLTGIGGHISYQDTNYRLSIPAEEPVHLSAPYGNGKPCISCGSMMTRGARTSHWEGGRGCRNKVKMNRNDRQKYANTNKTVSRKAAGDKK